jgi:hypothetical protein
MTRRGDFFAEQYTAAWLENLNWHWGEAYRIFAAGYGCWTASRRDARGRLLAEDLESLLAMIRDDYGRRPVPRRHDLPTCGGREVSQLRGTSRHE